MLYLKHDVAPALLLVLSIVLFSQQSQAQNMAGYYQNTFGLHAPAGSFENGLLGHANPAMAELAMHDFRFAWTTDGTNAASFDDWGVYAGGNGIGFGVTQYNENGLTTTDYSFSLAGGDRSLAFGSGMHFYSGDTKAMGRYDMFSTGMIARPNRYVSTGLTGNFSIESDDIEGILEVGVRPLGTPQLTLFADGAIQKDQALEDANWSAGAAVQLIPGVSFTGRYFDNEQFAAGISLNFGFAGLGSQSNFDSNQEYGSQMYSLRGGDFFPSLLEEKISTKQDKIVEVDLSGIITYRKFLIAEITGEGPLRFYQAMQTIEQAANNPRVDVLLVTMNEMLVAPEHAWEIREALRNAREAGKKVVIYMENAGMTGYHLASVADKVVMDPQGSLALPGYYLGRTFYKGTLEKLGLKFDEWRFFEYKSALESLSRREFSDADSAQRQEYVNDQYQLTRDEVTNNRDVNRRKYDELIDTKVIVTADEAVEAGLVDTLARWNKRKEMVKSMGFEDVDKIDRRQLHEMETVTRNWGTPPQIALIYALGPTSMNSGIKARYLQRKISELANDDNVKAVVMRADSPGGDAMAADLVAEALKKCAEKKPVIVSQGQVAGSGGYWISMYADTIVAGPNTITGSIGVIGGWLYDDGFSDKTGLDHDIVKAGAHADLMSGYSLPLGIASIPTRNLNKEEKERVKSVFMQLYDGFVEKVAEGRDTTQAHIRKVGEGHIFSGMDGVENGLVDEIATLNGAIHIAKKQAGLADEEFVEVDEIGGIAGLFNLRGFLPFSVPASLKSDKPAPMSQNPELDFIKLMLENQPHPMVIMRPDSYPWLEK